LKIVDAHTHLDEEALVPFREHLRGLEDRFVIVSNSVDYASSLRNLDLSSAHGFLKAFVGIHPQIFASKENNSLEKSTLEGETSNVSALLPRASGIGEIGLDPKFGAMELQEGLFNRFLVLAEKTNLPISVHSRESVQKIMDMMSTTRIRGNVLFHWFVGTESELRELNARGFYVSFGPSILFSKRLSSLFSLSDPRYVLPETDSPTRFEAIAGSNPGTPFLVSSVIFKMALLCGKSFEGMLQITNENLARYLSTQH
jgi:TatD DNase family protein